MESLNQKMKPTKNTEPSAAEIAARAHEIQTGLGATEVPEFDTLRAVGMGVRLALHIQGLPALKYETLRLVANHYLNIPSVALRRIVDLLAEVEFVKLQTTGKTINVVVPNVPYYDEVYSTLGDFGTTEGFNEAEKLSIEILCRLAKSPENIDSLRSHLGADKPLLERAFTVGQEGAYLRVHRTRGRNIALSPAFFSENADVFADMVAGAGASDVRVVLDALRRVQGVPLSLVEKQSEIGGVQLTPEQINMLKRLAQDGAVRPPSISTPHAGNNYFLFTPTPGTAGLAPTKREIYEKAMAIVAAVRQGQFLPNRYAIRSPGAVLYKLKTDLKLSRATTEATEQYRQLTVLRVARLVPIGSTGYSELHIIDTPENREVLRIAYDLVDAGSAVGTEVDEATRELLQKDQSYVESQIASGDLVKREKVPLSQEQQQQLELIFLK
ncbi:MAG: hypothetical protein V4457_11205 [Pseudomonadota bacterium]